MNEPIELTVSVGGTDHVLIFKRMPIEEAGSYAAKLHSRYTLHDAINRRVEMIEEKHGIPKIAISKEGEPPPPPPKVGDVENMDMEAYLKLCDQRADMFAQLTKVSRDGLFKYIMDPPQEKLEELYAQDSEALLEALRKFLDVVFPSDEDQKN